ncbi:LacI family DNA-binding transcriptional regulator [Paenibacillus sp. PAMC21692]|uniref:LacI family DNA-binding transcriptional regulator n=1 Tax=Paenibacillus sp. PAMC21692 TaxID=2762320 RepID=UPI00164EB98D|nr:LacI family DNA-binding transcriptional regulator [Paenibacillus sp. PAMC21692]QNK56542.1 LacI family DNA-binding transcriptional regulator [Paenibacillus sp. PAMC21692]
MVTLKDVAKLAGVAPITVSRVINEPHTVKEQTRSKVQQAIEQLGYSPNQLARGLATNQSNMIGVVVSNIANPYYADYILGIETKAKQFGKSVVICNGLDYVGAKSNLELLLMQRVDGIIFTSFEFDSIRMQERFIEELEQLHFRKNHTVPVVLFNPSPAHTSLPVIQTDNYLDGLIAMRHLLELGHARIGHLSLNRDASVWMDRFRAYKDSLLARGLPLRSEYIRLIEKERVKEAEQGAYQLLQVEERPTAIFAANDILAVGVLQAAHRLGIRVPDELSIIGVDGIELAQYSYPSLTSVVHPRYSLGEQSVDLLVQIMNAQEDLPSLIVKSQLQVRESTSALRGRGEEKKS